MTPKSSAALWAVPSCALVLLVVVLLHTLQGCAAVTPAVDCTCTFVAAGNIDP